MVLFGPLWTHTVPFDPVWSHTVQRLARPGLWSRDQDHRDQWVGLVIETETETQTSKVSRPRLIETKEFPSCRDRDLSRLDNLVVVETETHRDWMKIVETETLTKLFKEVL